MSLSPLFQSNTNNRLRIFFAGHETKRYDWPEALGDIIRLTGEQPSQAMLVVLASTKDDAGHGTIKCTVPSSVIHADGVYYHGSEQFMIMCQTADCPLLVIQDNETGKVVIGHCGKPAMRPCGTQGCGNIVTSVLSHYKEVDPQRLSVYIMAGICGKCYTHEQDLSHATPFYNRVDHGENRELGELNLIERIRHELKHAGIPDDSIEVDWRCTKETPEFASHRRGDKTRNTIIVAVN